MDKFEKLLSILANIKIESDSAVEIVKWYVVVDKISLVFCNVLTVFAVYFLGRWLWKIVERIYEKD